MRLGHRPEIDGLRAIAVAGVFLCHFRSPWFPGGYAGVDVFFVISGYLISGHIIRDLEAGSFSFKAFYIRRSRRIFPALLGTIGGSLIAGAVLFSPERLQELGVSTVAAALSISNILFWSQQGYFDVSANLKPLLHTWSLGVEEQFYLLWPLLLFSLTRWRGDFLAALLLLFAASLGANVAFEGHSSSIYFLLPFRVFEFCIGGLAIRVEKAVWRLTSAVQAVGTAAGVSMILISYIVFDSTSGFPSFPALLPCTGTALIILCGSNWISRPILCNQSMIYLGNRSYSLYLVHWPIAVFYTYAAVNPWTWKTGLWLIGVSLPIAELLYRYVEHPFRYATFGAHLSNRVFIPQLIASTMLMVMVGASAADGGWLWRLGSRALAYERLVKGAALAYGGDGCGNSCETSPGKPVAAFVIGDSNAQQYFAGLKAAFPDTNFRIFQFSSCPFFSLEFTRDFTDYADPRLYDEGCRAARATAFNEIRRSRAALIVSQIWVNFPLVSEKTGKKLAFPEFASAASFYADQLVKLQRELGASWLLVIGTIPGAVGMQGDPADCIFRPVLVGQGCENSRPDVLRRTDNLLLASFLGGRATFLDPFDALCDKTSCKIIDDIAPIYSDPNHLTQHGSELVLRSFRKALGYALSDVFRRSDAP
jgi:peptidoglycan/LPS O-acetylase OafA/YrhL